jgi:hypothetical protein
MPEIDMPPTTPMGWFDRLGQLFKLSMFPLKRGLKGKPAVSFTKSSPKEDRAAFRDDSGVGIRMGEASGNVVCIDVDDVIGVDAADRILPATGFVSGKPSRPRDHRYYLPSGPMRTVSFDDPLADEKDKRLIDFKASGYMAELTVDAETGERRKFSSVTRIAEVAPQALSRAVTVLAVVMLLARYWTAQGTRHDLSVALAGTLGAGGVDDAESEAIIREAARAARDEEADERVNAVATTRAKLDKGEPVIGIARLRELLPEQVVDTLLKWLNLSDAATPTAPSSVVDALVGIGRDLPLIRTQHDEFFVEMPLGGRVEAVELSDVRFGRFLIRSYFQRFGTSVNPSSVANAVRVLEAFADDLTTTVLHPRLLHRDGVAYFNLGGGWQVVIRPDGRFWPMQTRL